MKIGMIGSAETAHAVADRLERLAVPIVFDPVMVATSGSVLADEATIAAFERLMRLASVVTPNIPELEALGGEEAVLAHGCHLLAKGGHAEGDEIVDRLLVAGGPDPTRLRRPSASTPTTRTAPAARWRARSPAGSAPACRSSKAFEQAVRFVRIAILEAPGLGQGHGPLGHSS